MLPGLEFAARYVPAGDGEVGGDWYDVFTLPSGALCIVVGDVVGHGLPAAVAMGRLRSAAASLRPGTDDPAELLYRLDRQVRHFEPDVMATVLCALVDPSGEQMRLSTAGHPPPVISRPPDQPAAVLDLPADLPLGVDAIRATAHHDQVELPPGIRCASTPTGWSNAADAAHRRPRAATPGSVRGPAESVCADRDVRRCSAPTRHRRHRPAGDASTAPPRPPTP